jgi:hypothetical protein
MPGVNIISIAPKSSKFKTQYLGPWARYRGSECIFGIYIFRVYSKDFVISMSKTGRFNSLINVKMNFFNRNRTEQKVVYSNYFVISKTALTIFQESISSTFKRT